MILQEALIHHFVEFSPHLCGVVSLIVQFQIKFPKLSFLGLFHPVHGKIRILLKFCRIGTVFRIPGNASGNA